MMSTSNIHPNVELDTFPDYKAPWEENDILSQMPEYE